MINIIIADDHPIVRSGIKNEITLEGDIQVIAEAGDGDAALRKVQELHPDVLLLDISMPGMRAKDVLVEIKKTTACKVLVYTAFGDSDTVLGMLKAGADGFILKQEDSVQLSRAVRALAQGGSWYSVEIPSFATLLTSSAQPAGSQDGASMFTGRERQILQFVNEGKPNKAISLELEISERTVEYHLSKIMAKLNVKSRLEVGLWVKSNPSFTTSP